MGKYMKKARSGRVVMEVITQSSSGVRTRARSQAMEKKLIQGNNSNASLSPSASVQILAPAQISYLELRSRRLEKYVGFAGNEAPATHKTTASACEDRKLSDMTNSEIPADDSSSRLAVLFDEVQHSQRKPGHQMYDENQQLVHLYPDGHDEAADESSLQGLLQRSLQQWTRRGRAPPGVAHSRSNSRSNSVTREFPSLTRERLPHGILTRNKRKLGKQTLDTSACCSTAVNLDEDMEVGAICGGKAGSLVEDIDVETVLVENPTEESWSGGNRVIHEESQSSDVRERKALPLEDIKLSLLTDGRQTAPCESQAPSDMEIEDFLLQAEQQLHRQFRDRYNFDPQNGIPLPGRYDWVKL